MAIPPVGTRRSAGSVAVVAPGGGVGRPSLSQLVRAVEASNASNSARETPPDLSITPFIRSLSQDRHQFDAAGSGS